MGAMALHGYSSMELKSRSFTSKEPHVAREPQVADPCSSNKEIPICFVRRLFITGYLLGLLALNMETACSSETSVNIYRIIWRYST
jgi:hypothetical protein